MPFTDRYLQVPIALVENKETDLPVAEEGVPAIAMINPFDISCYCETLDDTTNSKGLCKTMVYFRNGESLYVELYLHEFEKLLNTFNV